MITPRTSVFQGLRLIGIVTIVAGHLGLSLVGGGTWCTFFFLLSGFFYRHQIGSWGDYGRYIWKKLVHIYPVYWTCLLAYLLLAVIRGCEEQYTLHPDFWAYFLLVQTWIPQLDIFGYMGPSWFLSSLLFCYVFSFLAFEFVSRSRLSVLPLLLAMVAWRHFGIEDYFSPVYRFFEYALGMWLRRWLCQCDSRSELFAGFNLVFLVGFLVGLHFGMPYWCSTLLFLLLIWCVYVFQSRPMQWLLGNRAVLRLSKADMFIYLSHTGIGFHLVFYFISYNAVVATIGSVFIGFAMCEAYDWMRRMLLPTKSD
ncbi:MAG: acyltransferase [Bacteroidales bacterium]|nr:acyltransferase [Bacteroidales bacterium]